MSDTRDIVERLRTDVMWHRNAAITLDCATMSPAHVVEALLSIGREQGRDEVRALMRQALAL